MGTIQKLSAVSLAVLASLAFTAGASAQRAHISVAKARGEIVRYFGPGTVVTKCKQFSPRLVGCDYEATPPERVIEAQEGPSRWYGFITVDWRGVHEVGVE